MRPACQTAQVIRENWNNIDLHPGLNPWHKRTLRLLRDCRTSALGGHIDRCSSCSHLRISYNSCRNRHCPKCQAMAREDWIGAREAELLPVPYFHVVFTLPDAVNRLCLFDAKAVYNALFESAWSTIQDFALDPKHLAAHTGMTAVLHTWGQNLSIHPHLHCIVPGGGITQSGKWKMCRSNGKFLFPVKALSSVFRARMVAELRKHFQNEERGFFESLFRTSWVVYAKRPFAGPKAVIEYLGRYTHRIAISDHRLKSISREQVVFSYKDYRQQASRKLMSLSPMEFIRRFALHILPRGFVRIRHYGILSSRRKARDLPRVIEQFTGVYVALPKVPRRKAPAVLCPCCKKHIMQQVLRFDHRGPPEGYLRLLKSLSHENH